MITIDYKDRRSIHEQLVEKITSLVALGVLPPGSQLPSIRSLASELSINPNTISKAFLSLETSGVIISLQGRGNFVSDDLTKLLKDKEEEIMIKADELAKNAATYGIDYEKLVMRIESAFRGVKKQ